MGDLYRPKLKRRPGETEARASSVYWCKYYVNGRAVRESTKSEKEADARRFLKLREGAVATGAPIPPRVDRVTFDELAADLVEYYRTTGRWKNLDDVDDRLAYLKRQFTGWRAGAITASAITAYVARRQGEKTRLGRLPANRTINLELALLRRMFRRAARRRKVLSVPPFEMLE